MSSRIGYFIGMALADLHHLVRGRQAVPCLVDWEESSPHGIFIGPAGLEFDPNAPTLDNLRKMTRVEGLTAAGFNFVDDCCPDYEVDCCLATDTIGEIEGKA